jgi:hypothetical protein
MSKLTKKQKAQQGKVDSNKLYPLATRWHRQGMRQRQVR